VFDDIYITELVTIAKKALSTASYGQQLTNIKILKNEKKIYFILNN